MNPCAEAIKKEMGELRDSRTFSLTKAGIEALLAYRKLKY